MIQLCHVLDFYTSVTFFLCIDFITGTKIERPVEFIADVTPKRDFWKLTIKVKDKWSVIKDGKEHLKMIIVDAKVKKIIIAHILWSIFLAYHLKLIRKPILIC